MPAKPLILHYAPDNASMVVRLALEEMGVAYETRLVDRAKQQQRSEHYLSLNPSGLIPVLEIGEEALFETAAILLWLSERFPGHAPQPGSEARGAFLKWLFFLSNTLHPCLRMIFYAEKYIGPDKEDQVQLRKVSQSSLCKHLQVLDAQWAQSDMPLLLDFYLAPMMRWTTLYPKSTDKSWFDLKSYPSLNATVCALERRTCVKAVQKAEGLGPTPFTKPQYPSPPEGSAL